MEFTGERYVPTLQGQIRLEHYHRYAVTLDVVKGKNVLDVACGEGYGSFLMADVAQHVCGVDISSEAVAHAASTYTKENLEFQQGSATDLKFPDAHFDVVVSFETIEHLAEQEQMLSEIRRVLRPDGILVISSPNRPVYSEESGEHNEFHVKELDFYEFDTLLRSQFPAVEYFGQCLQISSVIQPIYDKPITSSVWSDNGSKLNTGAGKLKSPVYFVALCGSSRENFPQIGMSLLSPESLDLVKHYVGFAKWAQLLDKTVAERDGQLNALNQTLTERDGQLNALNQTLTERDGQIAGLNQTVTERDTRISGLLRSRSWRLTRPLRGIGGGIRALRRALGRLFGRMPPIRQARIRRIRKSPLFDADFYAERNPDVVAAGVDLAKHYALSGWKEHRNPSAEFSTRRYLEANPDVAIAGINPLLHYIDRGKAEGRQIHPVEEEAQIAAIRDSGLFDADYYFASYPDIQPPIDPIRHYCEHGWHEGRNPSAEFDTHAYLAAYNDVKDAEMNPLWHYVVFGRNESRYANLKRMEAEVEAIRASGLFGADYYFATYPDIQSAMDPIRHYCMHGWHEGRNPSAEFDTQGYLEAYSDVKDASINPLWHYAVFGRNESRHANPKRMEAEVEAIRTSGLFDADYYFATYPDIQPPIDPIRHYCEHGWHEGRNPSAEFDTQGYLAAYNDVKDAGVNPLLHYLLFGRYESRRANPEQGICIETEEEAIPAAADIVIAASDNPLVSFIIPIYGKVDYTLRCLASIAKHLPVAEIEVIIVDDCSPDDSLDVLSGVKGIRLLRNKRNQGFIRSCNMGAKAAKGKYLYFLNNDTKVTKGWLDALLRTFSDFPGTGLAGSKLVYPDGRLQEAGGIIWQDGSAWNFGRFQNPNLPVYNYAREVDYCSGASIMVSKSLFKELGGFDKHYSPAYCEDSDLALKIRDKGYRVIYQPLSTVIHYEGITSGTDTTQGTKAYQVENSKKLFARWQQRLAAHQPPGTDVDNAKDRRVIRRVLVLDLCTPTPDQDAGSVTVFNMLLLLREMDFQVTFIPVDNFLYMPDYTTALQRSGIEVLYAPHVISVEQHLKEFGKRYDLALLYRPAVVGRHIQTVRKYCPNAKVLFHLHDLHYLRMSREAKLQKDKSKQKAAEDMQQREFAAIRAADASIVHSTVELEILQPLLPEARLHVFPLIMDVKGSEKTFSARKDIVFVGGYQHPPNVDAVQYFVKDVMPLLRKQLPGVRFYAVGSKPPAEIQALASEDVIITGFVEDLEPLLDKMRVSVAPLRYGAGIKGKIGTAMAVGLPVVATPLAAEGMSLTDGENILVADGTEALAEAIARIYQDEVLWNRISKNGLSFAEKAWGSESTWKILAAILADIGIQVKRGAHPLSLYSPSKQSVQQLLPRRNKARAASRKAKRQSAQQLLSMD